MSSGIHASHAHDIHWEDYEELVKDIYQALGRANGVTIECWGRSCKVEGFPWRMPPNRRLDQSRRRAASIQDCNRVQVLEGGGGPLNS